MDQPKPKTILIAEDQHEVRTLAALILEEQGFRVLEAADATQAQQLAQGNRIHLAIVDVWLPEMRGVELADALQKTSPGMALLYVAGFAARIPRKERSEMNGAPILKKPFAKEDLLTCVLRLLN